MTARVPRLPPLVPRGDVVVGRGVRGGTWRGVGEQAQHALAVGSTLIAAFSPEDTIAAGASKTYNLRLLPRAYAVRRAWLIGVRASHSTLASTPLNVSLNGGGDQVREHGLHLRSALPHRFVEILGSAPSSPELYTIRIKNDSSTTSMVVEQIACYELLRAELKEGTDERGIDLATLDPADAIYDPTSSIAASLGAVKEAIKACDAACRRAALFTWAVDDADFLSTTSGSFGNVLDDHPYPLARKTHRSQTTVDVTCAARAWASDGTTAGEIKFTDLGSGADVLTLTVTAGTTSPTWFDGEVAINVEDFGDPKGWRGGTPTQLKIEWKRTAGSGSLRCSTIHVGEKTAVT